VVAIDGPSGAGKSTAGRALAARLGYLFIDTGAMYRALALKALTRGIALDREDLLVDALRGTEIGLGAQGAVVLDGADVTGGIRRRDVSAAASKVSAHPAVRREMVGRQRALGREGGVILDGRDIGSAVFPDAEVKFYLDADPEGRARRRQRELAAAGSEAEVEAVEREIRERDLADSTRTDSPLTRTPDAVYLDTTDLEAAEVVERMLAVVRGRLASGSGTGDPSRGD
jgi:CMP/dCMP kinase